MPHINYEEREIVFKLVYYGAGLSGKTTNLSFIHQSLAEGLRGEMVSLDTTEERTLFFDFFPLELGCVEGYAIRFNMYTVPGQTYYEASRRLILEGADGVVFVIDSQSSRLDANLRSFRLLQTNLESYQIAWERFPIVLQYNKRDCMDIIEIGVIERMLDLPRMPAFSAIATQGQGVIETVRSTSRLIITRFQL